MTETNGIMAINTDDYWWLYWGSETLPVGAQSCGVVMLNNGEIGALIKLNGNYVRGNIGRLQTLHEAERYTVRVYNDNNFNDYNYSDFARAFDFFEQKRNAELFQYDLDVETVIAKIGNRI